MEGEGLEDEAEFVGFDDFSEVKDVFIEIVSGKAEDYFFGIFRVIYDVWIGAVEEAIMEIGLFGNGAVFRY